MASSWVVNDGNLRTPIPAQSPTEAGGLANPITQQDRPPAGLPISWDTALPFELLTMGQSVFTCLGRACAILPSWWIAAAMELCEAVLLEAVVVDSLMPKRRDDTWHQDYQQPTTRTLQLMATLTSENHGRIMVCHPHLLAQ